MNEKVEAAHRKLRELFGAVSIHVAEELVRVVLTTALPPLRAREEIARAWFYRMHSIMHDHEECWQRFEKKEIYLDCADAVLDLSRTAGQEWRRDIENAKGAGEFDSFLLSVECERNGEVVRIVGEAERDPEDKEKFWWQGQRGEYHADDIVSGGWTIVAWQPMPLPAPPVAEPKAGG